MTKARPGYGPDHVDESDLEENIADSNQSEDEGGATGNTDVLNLVQNPFRQS